MAMQQRIRGPQPVEVTYSADVLLRDGRIVQIRVATPRDRRALQCLHDRADDDSIYLRFFSMNRALARKFVSRVCQPDSRAAALVAEVDGEIVGLASAERIEDARAEVSLFVDDSLHGCGLGTLLLEHLAGWQRQHGIDTLTADVLVANGSMLAVFRDAGFDVTTSRDSTLLRLVVGTSPTEAVLEAADSRERRAEQASLRRILEPRSIAVVGVSRSRGRVGREVLENIRPSGFEGRLHAISPHQPCIDAVTVHRRLSDLREPIDLVVVAVPEADTQAVVRQAADAHAKGCIVLTSGFSEAKDHGREVQRQLTAVARSSGMRLVGPNCFGLISHLRNCHVNATFSAATPKPGRLAVASQSGGVGIAVLNEAARRGIGIASFVSLGNKADVSGNDLISAWTEDQGIEVAALYLESFGNPHKFARLARRFSERKPLLAVFGGQSVAGQRAGVSHTAASMTPYASVRALFNAAGVVGVSTFSELVGTAALFLDQPPVASRQDARVLGFVASS